jgi:drug/metabolite transporter (DMT)-like permease
MKTKLWLALLALYIVWGSTYLAIRFAIETMPPFLHGSLRFLISGAILYIWRRSAGDVKPTAGQWKSPSDWTEALDLICTADWLPGLVSHWPTLVEGPAVLNEMYTIKQQHRPHNYLKVCFRL